MDDIYKLGYTSNKQTIELVKQHLFQRYGTYFPDVECINLFKVKQPIQAEKHLFKLLKDYKNSNELVKADYEMTIKPQLEYIKQLYNCNNNEDERIITIEEKEKYKLKLTKKRNNFIKYIIQVENYILSNIDKFNKHNLNLLSNIYNLLSYYKGSIFPVRDKKILITNLSSHIQQFDYGDLNMIMFVEYIINLY